MLPAWVLLTTFHFHRFAAAAAAVESRRPETRRANSVRASGISSHSLSPLTMTLPVLGKMANESVPLCLRRRRCRGGGGGGGGGRGRQGRVWRST